MKNKLPIVTVVTVTYNAEASIRTTIQSIIDQTYSNIELIIIDGNSNDGTNRIIMEYNNFISHYVSEKDNGIYDAMNKGIKVSNGEYVVFMNAGDTFYSDDTILDIFMSVNDSFDLIYGDSCLLSKTKKRIKKAKKISKPRRMPICHQAMITSSKFLKSNNFDLKYELASDFDLVYKIITMKKKVYYFNKPLCIVTLGGASDVLWKKVWQEYSLIYKEYNKFKFIDRIYFFCSKKTEPVRRSLSRLLGFFY